MVDRLDESLEIDGFNRWQVDDLKKFIKGRGYKMTYQVKCELVAVAFSPVYVLLLYSMSVCIVGLLLKDYLLT